MRLLDGSGVNREVHAPFCERLGVRFPRPTHHEGFNTQKNHGYGLQHKFSRVSWQAAKNYYQCLQIGHLINQLMVLSTAFQQHLTGKMTLAHLWKCLLGVLTYGELDEHTFAQRSQRRIQIRFVT